MIEQKKIVLFSGNEEDGRILLDYFSEHYRFSNQLMDDKAISRTQFITLYQVEINESCSIDLVVVKRNDRFPEIWRGLEVNRKYNAFRTIFISVGGAFGFIPELHDVGQIVISTCIRIVDEKQSDVEKWKSFYPAQDILDLVATGIATVKNVATRLGHSLSGDLGFAKTKNFESLIENNKILNKMQCYDNTSASFASFFSSAKLNWVVFRGIYRDVKNNVAGELKDVLENVMLVVLKCFCGETIERASIKRVRTTFSPTEMADGEVDEGDSIDQHLPNNTAESSGVSKSPANEGDVADSSSVKFILDEKIDKSMENDGERKSVNDDLLGFKLYVDALNKLITDPNTQTPLTISLEGPWGCGKTTMMRMLQGELKQAPKKHWTVWFDSWFYEKDEQLWAALALETEKQIVANMRWWEKIKAKWALIQIRHRLLLIMIWMVPIITSMLYNMKELGLIDLNHVIGDFKNITIGGAFAVFSTITSFVLNWDKLFEIGDKIINNTTVLIKSEVV